MSHEFETGLFVTQPAWHGLGTVLDNAPGVDDALKLAGLDWTVNERPMFLSDRTIVPAARAMVRSTDGAILGVVGSDFTPLQNVEAFEWFRPLVDSGDVTIEAAGSLRGGKRVWILAALKGATAEVKRGDAVKSYVLVAHGHDGTLAVRAGFTTVRVVCQNTLSMSIGQDANKMVSVRHTSGVKLNLEKAREQLDVERARLKERTATYRELARRKMDQKNLVRYVREVLSPGAADDTSVKVRHVDAITELFEGGRGAELSRGTVWGAFNAVTEHLTHNRGKSQDSRQDAQWFGKGAELAQRALDVAVQFAEHAPLAEQGRQAYANHATAKADLDALLKRPARIAAESETT